MKRSTSSTLFTVLIAALVIGFAFSSALIPTFAQDACEQSTLANAINAANGGTPQTVTLASDCTITLSSALPELTGTLTINGNGATISGDDQYQVFSVGSGGHLTLNGFTITDGFTTGHGGGIWNFSGTLIINNSIITGNSSDSSGGGIANQGTLTITNSTVSNNTVAAQSGGGIYNGEGASATITDSTFSGNTATDGGAIQSFGDLTITGSTFSNNTASAIGGAIFNYGTLTASSSTFSGNTAQDAGGGIATIPTGSTPGVATITCSRFEGNTSQDGVSIEQGPDGALSVEDNWWGSPDGPNIPGVDTTNVEVISWLDAPDATCPPPPPGDDNGDENGNDNGSDTSAGPQLPPPPMANQWPGAELAAYDLPDGFYARILMRNGAWQVHAGGIPQGLIDNHVILAIDLFHLSGVLDFGAHVPVCLLGEGRLIFLDATTSPRALIELETFNEGGYTCGWIPNAGTLVLIRGN
jgi:predicted outer membrane repeat protein